MISLSETSNFALLCAGDIGEWQPDGTMKIIDRKNIFKLSQGEYVAVEVLESAYMQSPPCCIGMSSKPNKTTKSEYRNT
jgi:long-subunit acyl-CoA synthetase (AMP-forming)